MMSDEGRRIVLDSSVLISIGLQDEAWHGRAVALMRDVGRGALHALAAPNLRFEVRSGFVRAARRGRIDWQRVGPLIAEIDALELPVPRVTYQDRELMDLCRLFGVTWADAHHVRLALHSGAPLVTADLRLVRILRDTQVWVESIADRPMS